MRNRSVAGSLESGIGGWLVNDARMQVARNRDEAAAQANLYGPHEFVTDRMQFGDALSWIAGGHSFKAGADVLRDRNSGQFSIDSLFPVSMNADLTQYGAFFEDAWRATAALSISQPQKAIGAGKGTLGTTLPVNDIAISPSFLADAPEPTTP